MIPAMTERKRCHDISRDFCCCSHPTESTGELSWLQGDRALIRNTGYRRRDHASIHGQRAERRAGARTGPSTANGGLDGRHYADLLASGIDVSEKYLASDEEPCYDDSQPEPPLFIGFCNNFTINEKGDLGYFFKSLTGH